MPEKTCGGVEFIGGPLDGQRYDWPAIPTRRGMVPIATLRDGDYIVMPSPFSDRFLESLESMGPLDPNKPGALDLPGFKAG